MYSQTSKIRRTLVCDKIVGHSDVVGASPVGAAPTTVFIVDSVTYGFNRSDKDNRARRDEKHDLVCLVLEV